jgi:hypothetical protein
VNELLTNLRISSPKERIAPHVIAPSLPAPIRELLDLPDTLPPRPRRRMRTDVNGHRLPAGPAPPQSWLSSSRWAPKTEKRQNTGFRGRSNLNSLPGIRLPAKGSLVDACLRKLARDWEFHAEYDMYYLSNLQTRLRGLLLSYISTYGPEDGVGAEGLKTILRPVDEEYSEDFGGNEDFDRLDLSGSLGRSLKFKQLRLLLCSPEEKRENSGADSWENQEISLPREIQAPLNSLKYLSISYPTSEVSWRKLLEFASSVPTLTNLSLAFWPVPSLSPKSTTTTISSPRGNVQYGATNHYSHTLDNDWSDAAAILRRLALILYSLEWLDLDGCEWVPALRWETGGINWKSQWLKLKTIQMRDLEILSVSDLDIAADPNKFAQYKKGILESMEIEMHIRRKRGWIEILKDEWDRYDTIMSRDVRIASSNMMENARERWGLLRDNAGGDSDVQELREQQTNTWGDD